MEPQSLRNKVLDLVRLKGPVLPVHINKEIQRDSFFSGAILSELIAEKVVKISAAKIGGSPIYYVTGQEPKLSMLYDHLPMREKEAYNLLKDKKVLWDTEANPGIRVALRMIKDFAIPLRLQRAGREELGWRWYLLSDHEAHNLLLPQQKITQQQLVQELKIKHVEQTIQPQIAVQQQLAIMKKEELPLQRKEKAALEKTNFLQIIHSYVQKNSIQVLEEQIVRKNREYDFVITIPSNIGTMEYVLVTKNKKTINEADLSLAYQKGQSKKLPVILLTNGELTKKAREYREKNLKGYVLVKSL